MSGAPQAKTIVPQAPEQAKPGAFTPPRQIGPYELIRLLGRGGMAAVFEARHTQKGNVVALKVMDPNLKSDQTFVERFLLEVKASATLDHPHVVKVLDHGETQGWYFLATEYVGGGTVADLIKKMRALPAALAWELGAQLLDGLGYAHEHGIVHRDLKPENLLLTPEGVLKVADFGIARTADHTKLTRTGMLVGTAGYMSPEQAKGSVVDPRSDLFTVGIIFYEMLTGANPFESENPAASLTRILEQDLPPLFELKATVPPALEAVVDRLLAGQPEDRFGTAREALAQLMLELGAQRLRHPKLVAEALAQPIDAKLRLERAQAAGLVEEAGALLGGNGLELQRAALKLHLAIQLDPDHDRAREQLFELGKRVKLNFGPSENPKVQELEASTAFNPKSHVLFAQLANLYRLEGNLVRAVSYLKRYLRLKPTDAYVASQLTQLTGERRGLPPPAEKKAESTRDLVAGIKTGGLKAQAKPSAPPPPAQSAPVVAAEPGIFIAQVEAESPLKRALKQYGPWALLALALVLGLRWVSRKVDSVTKESEQQVEQMRRKQAEREAALAEMRVRDFTQEAWAALDGAAQLEQSGDAEQALAAYQHVMANFPKRHEAERAAFRRARLLQSLKRMGEAREAYAEFLKAHPAALDAPEALLRRGECSAALEDAGPAERDYTELLTQHPSSPLVLEDWVLRGELRARSGKIEGARADFQQAVDRLEPEAPLRQRAQAGLDALKTSGK